MTKTELEKSITYHSREIEKLEAVKNSIKVIKFFHDGLPVTANAIRISDAFYEINEGEYEGNLVHIFDIIRN